MSTRCLIAKETKNGYDFIYCHHDGYVDGVGAILNEYYTDAETIDKLLDLGDMSSLGIEPVDDSRLWNAEFDLDTGKFDYSSNGCTTYKGRGETDVDKKHVGTIDTLLSAGDNYGVEYIYVYDKDNCWVVYDFYDQIGENLKNCLQN